MKKWSKYQILCLYALSLITLIGCTRTRIIDKISIVHVFGFDQTEDGELLGTALFPEYTKSKTSDEVKYLEVESPTGVLFVPKMDAHTSTPVEVAKIRVLLFGKEYAEAGIEDMVERFIITPQLGTNIQIAVSNQSAKESLKQFKKEHSLTLADRLEQNMRGQSLPTMNLHIFLNHFYGEGMDAYVPMLTLDESDMLKVDGLAVFKDEKLKLHLKPVQTVYFSLLKDYRTQATLRIELDEEDRREALTVKAFRSKSKWNWDKKKERMNLNLKLQMTLTQYPNRFDVENKEDIKTMEKLIVEKIEKGVEDLLTTFKENGVDPLGIGNIVRSKDRNWKKEAFYEKYPDMPITVNVDLQIIHTGLES